MTIENKDNIYDQTRQSEKTRIDMLKEAFLKIEEKIAKELERSENNENNWLSCFRSRACEIVNILYFVSKELESDKQILIREKIQKLFNRLRELNEQYQGKNAVIPDEIKQELLDFLTWSNILGE